MDLKSTHLPDSLLSSEHDLLTDFYIPCLENSNLYQRAVGYFSGALVALAPIAFAEFVLRGGRIQLVCSPHLQPTDLEAITGDEIPKSVSRTRAYEDLVSLRDNDDLSNALLQAMSSLLNSAALDIRLLAPERKSSSIFHDKIGIFSDGNSNVSFIGSANETVSAWSKTGNHENIEVFRSWTSEAELRRIERHKVSFQSSWSGPRDWRLIRRDEVREMVFDVVAPKDIEFSLGQLKDLVDSKRKLNPINPQPSKNKLRELKPHQVDVLRNWELNNRKGIVCFATGGGKTLTGISAIRRVLAEGRSALVLVPSQLLHIQWLDEITNELPEAQVIPFGAGNPVAGKERILRTAATARNTIILSTYQTAVSETFMRAYKPANNSLIVADEVHNAGQPRFLQFLERSDLPSSRLGLSATPERFGDEVGTKAIFEFFGEKLEPEFGIKDAIDAGQLVPYAYSLLLVALHEDEQEEWDAISKNIRSLSAQANAGDERAAERLKLLLLKRANIAKKATKKPQAALELIRKNFKRGDRWLVYCSDTDQMAEVRRLLSSTGIPLLEYHQKMLGSRSETLDMFAAEGGVLLAIQCLDEGVDIPQISKALILASSTNPRQYIQRRGRVLRTYPGKYSAEIWDVLVTSPTGVLLTVAEARRALTFAKTSTSVATVIELDGLLIRSNMTFDADEIDLEEGELSGDA